MKKPAAKIAFIVGVALSATLLFPASALACSNDYDGGNRNEVIHATTTKSWFSSAGESWLSKGYENLNIFIKSKQKVLVNPSGEESDLETSVVDGAAPVQPIGEADAYTNREQALPVIVEDLDIAEVEKEVPGASSEILRAHAIPEKYAESEFAVAQRFIPDIRYLYVRKDGQLFEPTSGQMLLKQLTNDVILKIKLWNPAGDTEGYFKINGEIPQDFKTAVGAQLFYQGVKNDVIPQVWKPGRTTELSYNELIYGDIPQMDWASKIKPQLGLKPLVDGTNTISPRTVFTAAHPSLRQIVFGEEAVLRQLVVRPDSRQSDVIPVRQANVIRGLIAASGPAAIPHLAGASNLTAAPYPTALPATITPSQHIPVGYQQANPLQARGGLGISVIGFSNNVAPIGQQMKLADLFAVIGVKQFAEPLAANFSDSNMAKFVYSPIAIQPYENAANWNAKQYSLAYKQWHRK